MLWGCALRKCLAWFAIFLLAGCAVPTSDKPQWSGRMSVKVHSEPVQAFSAAFSLYGNPERGVLVLTSPIGTTIARLEWQPDGASLDSGTGVRRFNNLASLATEVTGTDIPVAAFFAWLEGREAPMSGWDVNLAGLPKGVLSARRTGGVPEADVRLVLDR